MSDNDTMPQDTREAYERWQTENLREYRSQRTSPDLEARRHAKRLRLRSAYEALAARDRAAEPERPWFEVTLAAIRKTDQEPDGLRVFRTRAEAYREVLRQEAQED